MPLEGEDGTRVKAAAVCHKDTSEWDPNHHIAFQVLKVKVGTIGESSPNFLGKSK